MNYYEIQQNEIATIKPRTFKLNLSDADVIRIFEKAGRAGLTPNELLEYYIGDLVYGTYSNGSDERMAANEWYDRCDFSAAGNSTFLKFVLDYDYIDQVIDLLNDIDDAEYEIKLLDDSDSDYNDHRMFFCLIIGECRNELIALFNEYSEGNKGHESFIDAIYAIKNYRQNVIKMLKEET